jgi:hypothetical protein
MGKMANHLVGMSSNGRLSKPSLQIHAYVGNDVPQEVGEDTKWLKQDLKRCKQECAEIKKALDNWVPEDVADRAEKSLRKELKRKEARMAELSARLDAAQEDEEEDEDEEEEA